MNKKMLKIILASTFAFSAIAPASNLFNGGGSKNTASAAPVKKSTKPIVKKQTKYTFATNKNVDKIAKKTIQKKIKSYTIKKRQFSTARDNSRLITYHFVNNKTKKKYTMYATVYQVGKKIYIKQVVFKTGFHNMVG